MVLYQNFVGQSWQATKIAQTAELSLTYDPMGNPLENQILFSESFAPIATKLL